MFVCNVAVGRSYNTTEGSLPHHFCPPKGFDSVIGEVKLFVLKESPLYPALTVCSNGDGRQACLSCCLVMQHVVQVVGVV